jgi:uncharacterized damage-inducible protein DinB
MTTANSSSVGDVTLIFKLNNRLVKSALQGLTDEEVWTRPHGGNAIGWILGHITETRGSILAELGDAAGMPWPKQFSRGSSPEPSAERPSRAVLEDAWSASSGRMRQVFERLTPDKLAELPKKEGLPGVTDVASFITFMAFHESYHVGQLGYARRLLGHSGVAG